jgi:glycosyltransferase involved in cell wall biosynthesis
MTDVYVNGAFRGQRITGQQRYATEVVERLRERRDVHLLEPPPAVSRRALTAHLWAHTVLPTLSIRGPLLSLTARSPVVARRHVVVVHDLFVLDHPEWYSAAYVRTHAPVLRAQLGRAAALAAVSPQGADRLRHMVPGTPVVLAPNAPGDCFRSATRDAVPPAVHALQESHGVEGFLCAVGSEDRRKNFARLVEAYGTLPPALRAAYPLVIAGGGSAVFAAAGIPAAEHVHRLGYVTDEQLAALYASATAVIVPSLDEGFGLPVVEALAAGGRVVVSDIPVFRWVAGDAASYFDPLRVEDLARAVREAVEQRPGTPDTVSLLSRFDWDRTASALVSAAKEVR